LNRKWEIVQKLFILKLEPDLDPEPEKLSGHGPEGHNIIFILKLYR